MFKPKMGWNQHVIALYNGEGCMVVHDDVFRNWFASWRADTNLTEDAGRAFVVDTLESWGVQSREVISSGDMSTVRMLQSYKRQYDIYLHVVLVPPEFQAPVQCLSWDKHPLKAVIELSLQNAVEQFRSAA